MILSKDLREVGNKPCGYLEKGHFKQRKSQVVVTAAASRDTCSFSASSHVLVQWQQATGVVQVL